MFILYVGIALYIITFLLLINEKSRSLILSIITLSYLNISMIYEMYLTSDEVFGEVFSLYLILIAILLFATIIKAVKISNEEDNANKALWLKVNISPTERDNFFFKAGCVIASILMGVSLNLPFFSVNVMNFSEKFSIVDLALDINERRFPKHIEELIGAAFILLVIYIALLLFSSFSKSKYVKTTIGLTLAISIACIVFVTRTLVLNAIEDYITGGVYGVSPYAKELGVVELIMGSLGSVFNSIFKLEFGVWLLFGSLAAYILFASCQLSRIMKPSVIVQSIQPTQVKVRCPACGKLNDDGVAFCNGCGNKLLN